MVTIRPIFIDRWGHLERAACLNSFRPAGTGSVRHGRPLRTECPLWRIAAGTPQGGSRQESRTIARGWGGAGSPSQRSGQHTRCRPCVAPRPRLRRGTPQEPGAPATPYVCRPVSNLPAWGRYQRPHYTVRRGLVGRPDGAKSAVGMCGPRVTQGPLPVGHAPLRATTIPGVCGPRGPPMAH